MLTLTTGRIFRLPNRKLVTGGTRSIQKRRIVRPMASATESTQVKKVAFQGRPGAYSELACLEVFPQLQRNPCEFFEDTFQVWIPNEWTNSQYSI